MEKEQLLDPQLWWHRLMDNPLGAAADAYDAMTGLGLLDISALWRQFYDDAITYDVLRWRSLLVYAIGCVAWYFFVVVRKKQSIVPRPSFLRSILPQEVTASTSFKIDVQFYLATVLKLPQIMKIAGLLLLASLQQHLVSSHPHRLPGLHYVADAIEGLPQWGRVLIAYLVALAAYEFGYYWVHRLSHKSKILWQFHKVHHYSRQLNILTGTRRHPVDVLVTEGFANLVMVFALCLFFDYTSRPATAYSSEPYWLALAVFSTQFVLQRFTHSHIAFSLGRSLDRVLVSPAIHILHHSRDISDTNFGNAVTIWDVAFGTFLEHDARRPLTLGISDFGDDHYRNIIQLLFEPFRDALILLHLWPAARRGARQHS